MATKPLRDLYIRNPQSAPEPNCELEDILELRWYNKLNDKGTVIPTTHEERQKIQESMQHKGDLFQRYIDKIGKLRFISQERVDKHPSYYADLCTRERACTNDGVEGYAVTALEATIIRCEIMLSDAGIGYMVYYLSHTNTMIECQSIIMIAALYKRELSSLLTQPQMKPIRAEMQRTLQKFGLSKNRSELLTSKLISEYI